MRVPCSSLFLASVALLLLTAVACTKRVLLEVPVNPSSTSPQILRFVAQPSVIHRGEKAVLTWTVRNGPQVLLEEALEPDGALSDRFLHSLGNFSANGTVSVSPQTSATYVLSCGPRSESGFACVSASVSVIVK